MAKQAFRNTREEVLERSVPLFAKAGFDGVSMRDIAAAVGVTPAALYHHFSDKEQLYLDAVGYAFEEKADALKAVLDGGGTSWERLDAFVTRLANLLAADQDFRRLMQWVMLDSDERRLHSLADRSFRDMFIALRNLAAELAPDDDPHLLVVLILGMVIYPFQIQPVRRFLPGHRRQHEDPEAIARHVVDLLRNGLGGKALGK